MLAHIARLPGCCGFAMKRSRECECEMENDAITQQPSASRSCTVLKLKLIAMSFVVVVNECKLNQLQRHSRPRRWRGIDAACKLNLN